MRVSRPSLDTEKTACIAVPRGFPCSEARGLCKLQGPLARLLGVTTADGGNEQVLSGID